MALEHKLELRLSQKLVLTPQLQMAIKLLQMPQLELSQTLTQELVENPFLEEVVEDTKGRAYERGSGIHGGFRKKLTMLNLRLKEVGVC